MKIIKEKTFTYVKKEIEVDMYETEDGKKYRNESDAIKHEKNLNNKKIFIEKYKVRDIYPSDYGIDYYNVVDSKILYIEELNDDTKNDLMKFYPYLEYHKSKFNDIKSGWSIFIEEEHDSCGTSRWSGYNLNIYNVNDLIDEKEYQIEKMKKI